MNHQHCALSAVLNLTLHCVVLQIRLTTSTLTIAKISAMVTDAVKSMQETAKAVLPDLETPDVPNLISQLPSELQSVTFSIDGSVRGDLLACACCFPCSVMQEAREIKKRGTGFLHVPPQIQMTSR